MLGSVMSALSVSPVGPATLSALNALRPVQPSRIQSNQVGNPSESPALSAQKLVQTLFQRTLQATSLFPVAEPASASAGLAQDVTASLLAALSPPPAPVEVTAAPDATTNATTDTTTNAAALQSPDTSTSTAPASTVPAADIQDLPAVQDALDTSLSPDFAMQTALRFGAGVAAEATAAGIPGPDLGTGLVRDATTVLRLENLQPRTGGPGPEAFAQPETPTQRILRTYETSPAPSATQGANAVDLLA
jgi:hypothetical protein